MENTCVCCGEYIPEGLMICYSCEKLPRMIFKKEDKKNVEEGTTEK